VVETETAGVILLERRYRNSCPLAIGWCF